jgi:cardiolipin synthase
MADSRTADADQALSLLKPGEGRQGLSETAVAQSRSLELARYYLGSAHPLIEGNRCTLLRDGIEAFPAMLEAISAARRTVRLETYMFLDDAVGRLFARALIEAAERGVRVRVLYDAIGSWQTKAAFFGALRQHGVDVHPFRPFQWRRGLRWNLRRDHRKVLVVDGEVAFVGGVNIAAHWAPKGQGEGDGWRDDVLRIDGPAAHTLERRFGASWRMQVQERLRSLRARQTAPTPTPRGTTYLSVLSSRRSIHRSYVRAIERARTSVLIAAGYFVPDRRMLAALKAAAQRGVEVSLILAGKSDHPVITWASRAFYERLMTWGVRIFEWNKAVLHAKTAVVDETWGTVGSFNLERLSLLWNHEVNVVFADRRLGEQIAQSFRQDCGHCQPISLQAWRARPFYKRMVERFIYLFRRIL